ncbi:alpha/beta hydrolase fold domain-containing protein [Duganella radicis]|uniref:Alpha/beta hydrolase fold domain-containing protein n=2 Tax=Duganella radicis TaxID=551988 RepID=A0A6L6PER0_9BURK|nr:alpha/beta hydrolase fold domain-containing protein [Duganella radicis]
MGGLMKTFRLAALLAACTMLPAMAQRQVTVDAAGTAHVREATIELSNVLSPASQDIIRRSRPTEGPGAARPPETTDMAELRKAMNAALQPNVQHMRDVFPVDVEETTLNGISVAIITPKGGVPEANRNRVMINAPGGGFRTGIRANGLLISIPVAAVGRFKVISLLYRQGPEYRFPAATEDFTKVYQAVLKDYKPANIGLVGCSAGGALVAQSVASFQKAGLPAPGVIGVYCAGLGARFMEGDSAVFAGLATGANIAMPPGPSYLDNVSVDDPAVTPANNLAVLAKFPPTIFATGTRDFAMSSAAYGHRRLLKAGVASELLIYDGLGHGFMTNPDYPEARDLYEIAAKFYDRYLGR